MTFLYKGYTAEGAARAGRVEAAWQALLDSVEYKLLEG